MKQEPRRLSFSRSFDTTETSLYLPSIVDELRSEDYDVDVLPFFQRISVSGEEMSGVSMLLYKIQRLFHIIILAVLTDYRKFNDLIESKYGFLVIISLNSSIEKQHNVCLFDCLQSSNVAKAKVDSQRIVTLQPVSVPPVSQSNIANLVKILQQSLGEQNDKLWYFSD